MEEKERVAQLEQLSEKELLIYIIMYLDNISEAISAPYRLEAVTKE